MSIRGLLKSKNNNNDNNIIGKKRKYEESMGYENDYEIVQDCVSFITNKIEIRGINWIDSYLENISIKK
jgi:hypothetical protein